MNDVLGDDGPDERSAALDAFFECCDRLENLFADARRDASAKDRSDLSFPVEVAELVTEIGGLAPFAVVVSPEPVDELLFGWGVVVEAFGESLVGEDTVCFFVRVNLRIPFVLVCG